MKLWGKVGRTPSSVRGALVALLAIILSASALSGETLNYTISYASGLNLGEAVLGSNATATGWTFGLDIDVSVPGFGLRDHYSSAANSKFCSAKLDKTVTRGSKKVEEHITFDQELQRITRQTVGGGKSEVNVPACAHDPLAFLQFVRKELAEGRLAPQQSVVLGSSYQVRFEYTGVQYIAIGKKPMEAERIQTTIKGPASDVTVEIFFAMDPSRTPVMAKIPSSLGAFVVELEK